MSKYSKEIDEICNIILFYDVQNMLRNTSYTIMKQMVQKSLSSIETVYQNIMNIVDHAPYKFQIIQSIVEIVSKQRNVYHLLKHNIPSNAQFFKL